MNKLAIKLIKMYKASNHVRGRCKYMPTCSTYGLECFQKFGFFKALFLTGWRILRCNPFSKGGLDPVPLSRVEKNIKSITSLK